MITNSPFNNLFIEAGNTESFHAAIRTLELRDDCKSLLCLVAENNSWKSEELTAALEKSKLSIAGGIFPEIIVEGERKQSGTLLIPLKNQLELARISLRQELPEIQKQIQDLPWQMMEEDSSLFVWVDALAPQKVPFLELLFNHFGSYVNYLGGGAGSLSFQPQPCVIDNDGIHENTAIIAYSRKKMAIGVAHGWSTISEPFKVTKASNNHLISLNQRPAFEVYREIVEKHAGSSIDEKDFFNTAKSYPLGIAKIDAERIIRDPFAIKENGLLLVDPIQEGEMVCVMHGNIESLLQGAALATQRANAKSTVQQNQLFCIDCISRVLFMQDEFYKEIETISNTRKINGALTIGEIANDGDVYLEMYNKTIVVAKW
ncbi:MAG: FIST C-terminal domain-containing protein [Hydrotalea sp.]|nr:FIST C-terminal domain-containing protein [Hydrotalea sp.]